MKSLFKASPTLAASLLLAACASIQPNAYLDETRAYVNETESLRGIADIAAASMNASRDNLEKASSLHAGGAADVEVEHYALLARKQAEIARERLALNTAQRELDRAETARQEMLLSARERRARRAEAEALSAKAEAELMALEAQAAREEAERAAEEARLAREQLNQAQADAEAMARELDELKAQASERGIVLTLEDIVFAFDSADLQPGGERAVTRIAEFLQEYSERQVLIEGHTDSVGSDDYNQALSERRAESVRDALVEQGIDGFRIGTQGLGEDYPVASNDDAGGRQANRRVELIVANEDGESVGERDE